MKSKSKRETKYFPISLGCVKNLVDMEYLAGTLGDNNWIAVNNADDADIIIINTCAFINDAETESAEVIREFENKKPVIVTGCMPQRHGFKIRDEFKGVKMFTGTESASFANKILNIDNEKNVKVHINVERKNYTEQLSRELFTRFHTFVKLSEGCGRRCAFCLIPSIRGEYRSR